MSKFWFRKRQGLRSKDMGYGWVPISWQGWVVVFLMLLAIAASTITFAFSVQGYEKTQLPTAEGVMFFISIVVIIVVTSLVAHKKSRP